MPFYCVFIRGEGIDVPVLSQDGTVSNERPIVGFYTSRYVYAPSSAAALEVARELVKKEWTDGPHALANRGSLPIVEAERVSEISWWRWAKSKNAGYCFYPDEDDARSEAKDVELEAHHQGPA